MKNVIILPVLILLPFLCLAQTNSRFDVGAHFTYLQNAHNYTKNGQEFSLHEYYLDLNTRYNIYGRWYLGAEFVYAIIKGHSNNKSYYLGGINLDFEILRLSRFHFYPRIGLSTGNFCLLADEGVADCNAINRIVGLGIQYNLYKFIDIHAGYYSHYPLTRIDHKSSTAMPFVGVKVNL